MSGKFTEETTNQTSIDGRTIDKFHRSISRLKLVGWLLVPEAILRGSVRITWLATWPIKKLLNIYARGPAFREGEVVSPFNTVDLYPLMSKLLGINPRPNNSLMENVTVVLRQPPIRLIRRSSQFEAWVRKVQHFFWIKWFLKNMFNFSVVTQWNILNKDMRRWGGYITFSDWVKF